MEVVAVASTSRCLFTIMQSQCHAVSHARQTLPATQLSSVDTIAFDAQSTHTMYAIM